MPGLVSNLASNVINEFERNIKGKGAVRIEKGFTSFISNEDMNDIVKIIKSLEGSNVLIDGITKTLKHETKNKKFGFCPAWLASLDPSLVQPVISSVVKGTIGRNVRRAERGYIDKKF